MMQEEEIFLHFLLSFDTMDINYAEYPLQEVEYTYAGYAGHDAPAQSVR